jgi:hypothetical protein
MNKCTKLDVGIEGGVVFKYNYLIFPGFISKGKCLVFINKAIKKLLENIFEKLETLQS